MGINAISANEINDNDLNGINSADVIGMDSVEDTDVISTDLTEDQNEEISQSDVLSDVNADSADEIEENANVNSGTDDFGGICKSRYRGASFGIHNGYTGCTYSGTAADTDTGCSRSDTRTAYKCLPANERR